MKGVAIMPAQGQLHHMAITRGIDYGLGQLILGFQQLGLQIVQGGFLLVNLGHDIVYVGLADIQIPLFADIALHQLFGAITIQFGGAQSRLDGLEVLAVGFDPCGEAIHFQAERLVIEAKQHIPFFTG